MDSSSEDDEDQALVVDLGSGMCRAGFSGDKTCRSCFSTVIGRHKYEEPMIGSSLREYYVGEEAQTKRGILSIQYPIERGIVTNWDDAEKIWHHIFYHELHVAPEEHSILLTEACLNPRANREIMTQLMFETFGVPALYISIPNILALYASGRTSGTVLSCGEGVTSAVSIIDGFVMQDSTQRLDIAGGDVTDYLMDILSERHSFTSTSDREIVKTIKEKLCYVTSIPKNESSVSPDAAVYELPDGQNVTLTDECFKCPECLFQPSLIASEIPGIHKAVHNSIINCAIDYQKILYQNILLEGYNTMHRGFRERVKQEITLLFPTGAEIKVLAPPERRSSVWIGGSVLSSLSSFRNMLVKREDYEEFGPTIVHRKCF